MASGDSSPTTTTTPSKSFGDTVGKWVAIALVVLVLAFLLAALVPRWWAQQVGNMVDGRISYGSMLGIVVGFVFTFLPLISLVSAWRYRQKSGLSVMFLVIAVILATPNLMTLWVALGTGSSAHAGQRVLDVDGPGFRGGTLVGAVIGAGFGAYLAWLRLSKDRRKRQDRLEKERQESRLAEQAAEAEARPRNGSSDAGSAGSTDSQR